MTMQCLPLRRWKHERVLKCLQSILPTQYLLLRISSRQNSGTDMVCHWNSHFSFFIVFLLSTLSENQNLPVGFLLLLLTGLDLICNSPLVWLGFPLYFILPTSPHPLPEYSAIWLCCLLHSSFSRGIFTRNHFFLLRK